ncbi:MAG: polysaccharide deacetylase family protein [Verrucomicrobiota bacterium]
METLANDHPQPIPVSFVFDDGFTASCLKIADVFESRGLRATFAVLVDHDGFMPDFPKGDFQLWNELLDRGHEIHPHGLDHSDLTTISHEDADRMIDDCLNFFQENLSDFKVADTVYHLTYNRSTPSIDSHLLNRVAAIRTNGKTSKSGTGLNTLNDLSSRIIKCTGHGPGHCDEHLQQCLSHAEESNAAQFCYMLHGLDNEGWGPISQQGLEESLDTILVSNRLFYQPIGSFVLEHVKPASANG